MKVAFDENIPWVMVKVFETLAKTKRILNCEILGSRSFSSSPKEGDVPWMQKFKQAGGQIIISGDTKIRSRPHEQEALVQAKFVGFFFTGTWAQKNNFVKCAMLLNWWPKVRECMESSKPGDLWEIPFQWAWTDLKSVKRK